MKRVEFVMFTSRSYVPSLLPSALPSLPLFHLRREMGEWVPLSVMEAKLQHLMVKGLLLLKGITGWRAPAGKAMPHP